MFFLKDRSFPSIHQQSYVFYEHHFRLLPIYFILFGAVRTGESLINDKRLRLINFIKQKCNPNIYYSWTAIICVNAETHI